MAYSVVFPPEMVAELYRIRQKTGVPVRRQMINAVQVWLEVHREAKALGGGDKLDATGSLKIEGRDGL